MSLLTYILGVPLIAALVLALVPLVVEGAGAGCVATVPPTACINIGSLPLTCTHP